MNIQISEHILLTGAGFTKNYGAPLAIEMWAEIFNHKIIQAQPQIKELMQHEFDYESIYYSIIESNASIFSAEGIKDKYSDDEKKAIKDAVKFAYDNIDTILRKYARSVPYPVELSNLTEFIHLFHENGNVYFMGPNNVKYYSYNSFIFTLNQDLFFERLYPNNRLSIPGIKNNSNWFTILFRDEPFRPYCKLPNEDELNQIKPSILSGGNFFLIKLHGSCNWKSFDGSDTMVIGRGKNEQIRKEPLLKYYFEIFEKVLSQERRRLLIIGYGFGDDHVNRIISDAVRNHGLKIYIISPESPKDLQKRLSDKEQGELIWKGISGYYPYSLKDIYSGDSSFTTQESKNIKTNFFE